MLLLPEPFGPTMAVKLGENAKSHCLPKLLKPLSLSDDMDKLKPPFAVNIPHHKRRQSDNELWNGLFMGLRTTRNEYAKKSQAEHKEIYSMFKACNSEGAAMVMREHILRSMEDMLKRY